MKKILVVEDEEGTRKILGEVLKGYQYKVSFAKTVKEAKEQLEREFFPVVLLDLWLPDGDGLDFISKIKALSPLTEVVVITGHGSISTAVRAIKEGAYDFLEKPFSMNKLLLTVERAYERVKPLKEEEELIGDSPPMRELKELIVKVAKSDSPVLIEGESGTGKELVAKLIHKYSKRKGGPFLPLNCSAIPENLFESELFGYERGAFTGANRPKVGKFELANSGTLFLDEIGDLPLTLQPKLLRVLETGKFMRLGGAKEIEVDVRVICATNKDLRKEVEGGRFREDLYYRISVLKIRVPPLRERGEDIIKLAEHFLEKFCKEYKKRIRLKESAKEKLLKHPWKGNVRELKNLMERLVILMEKEEVEDKDLPLEGEGGEFPPLLIDDYKRAKREFERLYLERKLRENNWNVKETAKKLNMDWSSLYKKIKELRIGKGL